jgi:hypothetical protein
MKKIGILTFHYADNYGAVLQAYALRKIINSLPDCKAEIINYVPKRYVYYLHKDDGTEKKLLEKRRKLTEEFLMQECGICSSMIYNVKGNDYDYYCVGSDQVWNIDFRENKDLQYFLPNLDDKATKIAYAASIGMEIERIDEKIFKTYLPQFNNISLRESNYIDYIEQICNVKCEQVLDPALLLNKDDYEYLIDKERIVKKPYIFFFWYKLDDEMMRCVEFVNTLSRKYGLSIVHSIIDAPRYMFNNDAGCMMNEGVEGFLWYMKHAEFVITNSFHGAVFATQFERPFYIFISNIRRSRLDNLVEILEVEDRIINGYISPNEMNKDINFEAIRNRLEVERYKSMNFLRNALDIKV